MRCTEEDIEFANEILTRREGLNDEEVGKWMNDPEHVELLKEFSAIYQAHTPVNFEKDTAHEFGRLKQTLGERKRRRITLRWSIAASLLLMASLFVARTVIDSQDMHETKLAQQEETFKPGRVAVELTLADGRTVSLNHTDEQVEGTLETGIHNDSLQGLSYVGVVVGQNRERDKGEVYNTLRVPTCGFYQLELSDGTKVWLNSVTELRYPVEFTGKERKVYLSGEAYFEVTHDTEHPFVVNVEGMDTRVYGTKFNVNAYDQNLIQTTLVSGSVGIQVLATGKEVMLQPNQMAEYTRSTRSVSTKEVDPYTYTAWKDGKFVFESITLELIMHQLERWYGIDVVYQNPQAKDNEFRGVINRDMDLEKVLSVIKKTSDVTFKIEGKTVTVSNKE